MNSDIPLGYHGSACESRTICTYSTKQPFINRHCFNERRSSVCTYNYRRGASFNRGTNGRDWCINIHFLCTGLFMTSKGRQFAAC